MPVVPFSKPSGAPALPKVEAPWLLMAAAQMDAQGRLIERGAESTVPSVGSVGAEPEGDAA
jgi:hypothetical protein